MDTNSSNRWCAWRGLWSQEGGATGVEYALMAWLIAIAVVAALLLAGGAVGTMWDSLGNCVASFGKNCSL